MHKNILLLCVFLTLLFDLSCSEVILTTLSVMGGLAGGWYTWDVLKENTFCRYAECCNDRSIPFNIDKLKESLSENMFGQPLVNELVSILRAHKEAMMDKNKANKKALVISLHGWSGVGKNYAAEMIANAIYAKGLDSKYVKLFMGKKDFGCNDLDMKKQTLITTLNNMVKNCPRSLIIFDEIHHMCPSVLDAIKPMFDHYKTVDGVDYRNSIFIFISNIGGNEISSSLLDLYGQGMKRNDVEFHNFEPIIRRVSYFQGGFEKAATIAQHLIDHYIPFLPLEQHHVEMCARSAFRKHGIYQPTDEMMIDAMTVITYGPSEEQPIFANNGCKRFTRHIPYVVEKHKQKTKTEL